MLVSVHGTSSSALSERGAGDTYRVGHVTIQLPDTWWMCLGGPLGLLSIGLMAILVRSRSCDAGRSVNSRPAA